MRPDRRMSKEEAIEIIKKGKYGVLSTSTLDGIPYGVPVNFFYEDNALYFHCFIKGRKIDNILENKNVSFVVVGYEKIIPERFVTHYDSVIISGIASVIEDDETKSEKLLKLCQHLAPDSIERRDEVIKKQLAATRIVKIDIVEISGKKNRDA